MSEYERNRIVNFRGEQIHIDSDGRAIEQRFFAIKRMDFIHFLKAFEKLNEGSGALPHLVSVAVSRMQSEIEHTKASLEAYFGIKHSRVSVHGRPASRDDCRASIATEGLRK